MANPLSPFQPLARPVAAPGHCYLCRGIEGPFINTGVSVIYEGMVIICHVCIKEMFKQLDLEIVLNQTEFDEHGAKRFAEGAAVGQKYVLESLRDFVGEFVPADYSVPSSDPVVPDSPVGDSGEPEDSTEPDFDDDEESGKSGENQPGADGSSVESLFSDFSAGRDDVSSNSSDGAARGISLGL